MKYFESKFLDEHELLTNLSQFNWHNWIIDFFECSEFEHVVNLDNKDPNNKEYDLQF